MGRRSPRSEVDCRRRRRRQLRPRILRARPRGVDGDAYWTAGRGPVTTTGRAPSLRGTSAHRGYHSPGNRTSRLVLFSFFILPRSSFDRTQTKQYSVRTQTIQEYTHLPCTRIPSTECIYTYNIIRVYTRVKRPPFILFFYSSRRVAVSIVFPHPTVNANIGVGT